MNRRRTNEDRSTLRLRIAREAARLMARKKATNFHTARMRAMRWLSQQRLKSSEVPNQEEIMRELDRISSTTQWEATVDVRYLIYEVAELLEPFDSFVAVDWQAVGSEQVVAHWLVPSEAAEQLNARLQNARMKCEQLDEGVAVFNGILNHIYFHDGEAETFSLSDDSIEHLRFNPADELRIVPEDQDDDHTPDAEQSWAEQFRPLLESLANYTWDDPSHAEGDALYHSLQVFELGCERHPYDVEFLWACLLHDIGFVIDPRLPQEAAHRVLEGRVTERVLFFIEHLDAAHQFLQGESAAKSLRKSVDFDQLLDLARCDRDGRVSGKSTRDLPAVLEALHELEMDNEW